MGTAAPLVTHPEEKNETEAGKRIWLARKRSRPGPPLIARVTLAGGHWPLSLKNSPWGSHGRRWRGWAAIWLNDIKGATDALKECKCMTTQDTDAFTHVCSCSDEALLTDLAFVCCIISSYRSYYCIYPSLLKIKVFFPKLNWIKRLELLLLSELKTGLTIVI